MQERPPVRRLGTSVQIPLLPDEAVRGQPPTVQKFQDLVLTYYRDHGRDLPWRKTTDPYHILVSEIMLQQTQVGRVLEKYPAFIAAFPDFGSLAAAPLADVLSAWQGMGYNRRAIYLRECAGLVVAGYNGMLPSDPAILATFPGIGKATAASICAFAYNRPVVFIETNIRRVFIHYFCAGAAAVDDSDILPLVKKTLYRKDPRTWYNALMDLGTLLKLQGENPNRRSRHYTRQAPFAGSDREIRGSILRLLLAKNGVSAQKIAREIGHDPDRTMRILADLEKEGFVVCSKNRYSVPSR